MRELFLILHFIGLAMGLGTSFGFLFLGIAGSKMDPDKARQFSLDTLALSRMGHIGLGLLIISGGYLMTPYWSSLTALPLLMIKLAAVVVLVILVVLLSITAQKARQGDADVHMKKMTPLGRISLLTTLAIVVLAVLIFH